MMNPRHKPFAYRILEMIPGCMVWFTFGTAIILSLARPIWGVYFILIFDLYWVLRIIYLLVYLNISWKGFRRDIKIDWWQKLQSENPEFKKYYHAIFLPSYKEPLSVLNDTFRSLIKSRYAIDRFIVVLSGENRDKDHFLTIAKEINDRYRKYFYDIIITVHPSGLPGEIDGKGSNAYWMAKKFNEYIQKKDIREKYIIVSNFDCDTQVHEYYFAYLTYKYLSVDNPTRYSYQPVALFNNNIWESPFLTRIVYNSTTFWLFTDLARPERLFTFSSHSMSWVTLKKVRYWQPDIVTEDSRICLQAMLKYHGDYSVMPMYIPLSMDTAYIGRLIPTLINQYKQQRRWAYGVENFPYIVWNFWFDYKMSLAKKLRYLWNQLEGVYSWATAPILIFIMGFLPLYLLDESESASVLAQNAPFMLKYLMWAAMIGLIFSAALSSLLMPNRPTHIPAWKYIIIVIQWLFFPLTMVAFGSIPATEAQTRLLIGKYLDFRVTSKTREV